MPRYQSYIICTSPRSGSTLLCRLLAATGQSGNPDSHFHVPKLSAWLKSYGLSEEHYEGRRAVLNAVFDAARELGTGETGIFGLRMQRESFDFFMQQLEVLHPEPSGDLERLRAAFGPTRFIHLTRGDKLEQAISLVKARQTGLWHRAADGTELERTSAPQEPVYDADEIAHQLKKLTALDEAWRAWFAQQDLTPLRVTYEELAAAPADVLGRVLDGLDLDRDLARGVNPPVAKLADATNRVWAERFRAERGDAEVAGA